jgi:4-hydroxy-tetrahydrodipicolinate reductase
MNIALIGYGKMGKEIEVLAPKQGLSVVAKFDIDNNRNGSGLTAETLRGVDVCIDFSVPSEVLTNLRRVAECGKNLVMGTTGWQDRLEEARQIVDKEKIGLVYAANFSMGVNLFLRLVEAAGKQFAQFEDYDLSIQEIHHKEKLDSPSGTALEIGKTLLRTSKRKKVILAGNAQGKIKPEQLQISSTRVGSVMGVHSVIFDSLADTIELKHTAKNRSGFALGALLAAKWINGKRGWHSMQDVLKDVLQQESVRTTT